MDKVIGSIIAKLKLNVDSFNANIAKVKTDLNNLNKGFAGADALAAGFTQTGKTMTKKVTAPILALGGAVVKISSDFESAMKKVEATSGATTDELVILEEKAREMGAATIFSASEAADGMYYMSLAGWETEEMLAGLEPILKLAGAAEMDLATTSDIVTDSLTAFGLEAQDTERFTDILAATMANSNTDVLQLGEAFKYAAPLAGALGFEVDDVALAIGLMANSGIKGSQAGTTLRRMFTSLTDDIKFTTDAGNEFIVATTNADGTMRDLGDILDDARQAFNGMSEAEKEALQGNLTTEAEKLGIALEDNEGNLKTQAQLYEEVMAAVEGLTEAGKVQQAEQIASKTGMAGLLAIVNTSEEDYNALADAIANSDGAASDMYDTMTDSTKGAFQEMKSALEELALTFKDDLLPPITNFIKKITEWIRKFASMDAKNRKTIITLLAIAAAIGPILLIIGKVIAIVTGVIKVLKALKIIMIAVNAVMAANPIILIILAIIALIAIVVLLIKHWDKVKEVVGNVINWLAEKFTELGQWFANLWENIKAGIVAAWTSVYTWYVNLITGLIIKAITIFLRIKNFLTTLWSNIKNGISNKWNEIKENIVNKVNEIKTKIIDTFTSIKEGIKTKIDNIKTAIVDGIQKAIDWIKGLPEQAVEWGKHMIQGFIDGIKAMIEKVKEVATDVANTIKDFLGFTRPDKGPLHEYEEWMPHMIEGLMKSLKGSKEGLIKEVDDIANKLSDSLNVELSDLIIKIKDELTSKNNGDVTLNYNRNGVDGDADDSEINDLLDILGGVPV